MLTYQQDDVPADDLERQYSETPPDRAPMSPLSANLAIPVSLDRVDRDVSRRSCSRECPDLPRSSPMPDHDVAPRETATTTSQSRGAREEAGLFERQRTGDLEAREELVARFLPLAKRLALRYKHRDEYDDLVQVASVALIKAIDRYDPGRGPAFSAYAVPTIVGALKRYFRDFGWTVHVPRELHDHSLKVQRTSEQMTARLGRSPTLAEIADALECSVERVLEALQTESARRPDSLDAPTDPDDDYRERPTAACEETGYATVEAAVTLAPLLAGLTPFERRVLRLRFQHDLTQTQIGSLTGVSQMHVSRLLRKTIAYLRDLAEEANDPSVLATCRLEATAHDAPRGR